MDSWLLLTIVIISCLVSTAFTDCKLGTNIECDVSGHFDNNPINSCFQHSNTDKMTCEVDQVTVACGTCQETTTVAVTTKAPITRRKFVTVIEMVPETTTPEAYYDGSYDPEVVFETTTPETTTVTNDVTNVVKTTGETFDEISTVKPAEATNATTAAEDPRQNSTTQDSTEANVEGATAEKVEATNPTVAETTTNESATTEASTTEKPGDDSATTAARVQSTTTVTKSTTQKVDVGGKGTDPTGNKGAEPTTPSTTSVQTPIIVGLACVVLVLSIGTGIFVWHKNKSAKAKKNKDLEMSENNQI